jgi:hypothetical protein
MNNYNLSDSQFLVESKSAQTNTNENDEDKTYLPQLKTP